MISYIKIIAANILEDAVKDYVKSLDFTEILDVDEILASEGLALVPGLGDEIAAALSRGISWVSVSFDVNYDNGLEPEEKF